MSLLIQPVQRIPRYQLLLAELIKRTPEDHIDYQDLTKALGKVVGIATFVNDRKRQSENARVLQKLQSRLTHTDEIIQPHRKVLDTGVVNANICHIIQPKERKKTIMNVVEEQYDLLGNSDSSESIAKSLRELLRNEAYMNYVDPPEQKKIIARENGTFMVCLFNDLIMFIDETQRQSISNENFEKNSLDENGVYLLYLLFAKICSHGKILEIESFYQGELLHVEIMYASEQERNTWCQTIERAIENSRKNACTRLGFDSVNKLQDLQSRELRLVHETPKLQLELTLVREKRNELNQNFGIIQKKLKLHEQRLIELQQMIDSERKEQEKCMRELQLITEGEITMQQDLQNFRGLKEVSDSQIMKALSEDYFAYNLMFGTRQQQDK
jgi:hypothetical protein